MMTSVFYGQAGTLSFGSITTNPTTGYAAVPIVWEDNTISSPVFAVRIGFYIAAGTVLCLDETATKNSVASPFSANDVSINGGSVLIFKSNVTLPTDFSPLIVLYFRDAPDATAEIGFDSDFHHVYQTLNSNVPIDLPSPDTAIYEVPSGYSISGLIRKAPLPGSYPPSECEGGSDIGIPDITVSFQAEAICFAGSSTNPFSEYSYDGYYESINVPRYYEYEITPRKDDDTACDCGLDMRDIDTARLFILGSRHPTLQQLIAADFNGNDTLTTYDLVLMTYCSLGIPITPAPGWLPWRFVPRTAYDANNPPPTSTVVPPLPYAITTASLTGNLPNQDFYGIKRGDVVEQDCTECGGEEFSAPPPTEDRDAMAVRDIFIENCALTAGKEYALPLRFSEMGGMSILSLELLFDAETIEVLGIEKPGATKTDYLTYTIKKSGLSDALRLIWFTMEQEGIDVAEGESVFHVRVKAKKDALSLNNLVWQNAVGGFSEAICSGCETNRIRLNLEFHDVAAESGFSARLVGNNPTRSTSVQIALYLPEASAVSAAVFDMNGQQVRQTAWLPAWGWNTLDLTGLPDSPGIYAVHLVSEFGLETFRLVKL